MSKKATDKKSAVPNLNQDKDQAPNSAKGKGNSKKTAPTTETKETKKKSAIDKLDLAKVDDIDRTEIEVEKKIDPTSPCVLSTKAYRRMVIYGLRYANFDIKPKNWREVYGILVGKVDKKGVCHILDAIPMVVGDRAGVIFETKQYVDMAQIDQSIFERAVNDQTGQFICGWWHTHPGFGFFFSEVDTITQLGYQIPNPFALGIVFDHTEKTENFPGVEALRLDDPTKGVLAEYITSELEFDKSFDEVKKEADRSAEKILPKFKEVKESLDYIHEELRKKKMAQLQRNYGLILVPRSGKKETEDEELAEEENDKFLYIWDPDFSSKKYRKPKFRENLEERVLKAAQRLEKIAQTKESKKFDPVKKLEAAKKKYREEIEKLLKKPKEWVDKLKTQFFKIIEQVDPFYDYLDTEERKIIEYLDERINKYTIALDSIEYQLQFKSIQVPENKKEESN